MSDHWLGALQTKMESTAHGRRDDRSTPAPRAGTAARASDAPRLEIEWSARGRGPHLPRFRSGEGAR